MAAPWNTAAAQAPAYPHSYPGGHAAGQHGSYPSPYDQNAYAYQGYSYPGGYDPATYYQQQYQQYPASAGAGQAAPPTSAAEEQPPLPPGEPPVDGNAAGPAPVAPAAATPTSAPAPADPATSAPSPSAYPYYNPYQQPAQSHAGTYGYSGAYAPHGGYNPYQQHAPAHHQQQQWPGYPGTQAWQPQHLQHQHQYPAAVSAAAPPKEPAPAASHDPLAGPSNGTSSPSDYRSVPPPGGFAGANAKGRESKAAPGTSVAFSIKAKPIASSPSASSWSAGTAVSSGSNQVPLGSKPSPYGSLAKQPAYISVAAAKPAGSSALATTSAPKVATMASAATAAAAAAAAANSAPGGGGVPPSLQQYVTRCLSLATAPGERERMRQELIRVARDARANGTMWTTAWDREPAPVLGGSGQGSAKPDLKRSRGQDYDSDSDDSRDSSRGSDRRGSPQYVSRRGAAAVPAWRGGKAFQPGKAAKGAKKGAGKEPNALDKALGSGKAWSAAERAKRAKRMDRFEDDEGAPGGGGRYNGFSDRFAYQQHRRALIEEAADEGTVNWADFVVKGTCKKLEKSYFRLTSAPNPAEVRPPAVLKQALQRLVGMIAAGESNYFYYNDQFKALRQDCTVQQLRDELAVQVYEAHGRAALEYGDHAEYNQCQTQLAQLYADGKAGSAAEFAAYKVLYQAVHARHGEVKALMGTMRAALGDEVGKVSDSPAVLHALKVRAAIADNNWKSFFQLYAAAPNLGQALMDLYVPRMRFLGLNFMARAFRPSLPLSYLTALLGFQSPAKDADVVMEPEAGSSGIVPPGCSSGGFRGRYVGLDSREEALQACLQWALACKALFDGQVPIGPQHAAAPSLADTLLNCKDSVGKLEMPPDTTKVAHGDANMSIEDFLAKL